MPSAIAENLHAIREKIATAAQRAKRDPGEITLVAVSKTFPAEAVHQAVSAGITHFGENRVQEAESKFVQINTTLHLIGHLQSNKARRAAEIFNRIDSVDNLSIARKLNDAAKNRIGILIEVHQGEAAKSGAPEPDIPSLAREILNLPNLNLLGLMAIPPYFENPDLTRPYFKRLKSLHDEVAAALDKSLPILSMGMSHDFEIAIEEGATEIRIGTALFGLRNTWRSEIP
ncbi:MAG TPA: YggS family pyridoxal phosphate-dependent enzyme [Candidatus Acidoferrum sp.]|jgi:pyridoxal phosphate enzyme (YggS family)|nr:YggS family pyridoxal phosphate-dependent enzyme [Candidatus Acidoferrum sp.]